MARPFSFITVAPRFRGLRQKALTKKFLQSRIPRERSWPSSRSRLLCYHRVHQMREAYLYPFGCHNGGATSVGIPESLANMPDKSFFVK